MLLCTTDELLTSGGENGEFCLYESFPPLLTVCSTINPNNMSYLFFVQGV